ncbi:MAG TPA: hypothetical protein G4N92_04450 [Anaerolineae bacterium]|nr:hypothetical protein [Anaerolineae bacterium]
MKHKTYKLIIYAMNSGTLIEPFSERDFRRACPGLPEGTYKAFLHEVHPIFSTT